MATMGKVKGCLSNLSFCTNGGEVRLLMKKYIKLFCDTGSLKTVKLFITIEFEFFCKSKLPLHCTPKCSLQVW